MTQESSEELRARLLADEQVRSMIAMRAYEIFELRGGAPGHEAEDWLQAEADILKFVIDEEIRQNAAHSSFEEPEAVEGAGQPFAFPPYDFTERRMDVFTVVETEVVLSSGPAAHAEPTGGETPDKKAATQVKAGSREAKSATSQSKKAAGLKPPKISDRKASGKVKAPKKSGKTKESKHRSTEREKGK